MNILVYLIYTLLLVLFFVFYLFCTDSPKEPYNIRHTLGVAGISVSWEHDRPCFEGQVFEFIVIWQKGCTCDHSEMSTTVSGTTIHIRNLEPDTTYKICVSAVSTSTFDDQVKSERKCLHTKTLKLVCT